LVDSHEQFLADEKQFRTEQRQTNAKHEQAIQRLEVTVGQMAKELSGRKQGEFSAQTIPNPGGHHQLKAVTVLRSEKVIGTEETEQSPPQRAANSKVSKMEREYPSPPFP
jgi:hypothetical protein